MVRLSGRFRYLLSCSLHGSSPCGPTTPSKRFGLFRIRSPLLSESLLISFPGLLRWFTSSSLAPVAYFIQLSQVYESLHTGYPIRLSRDQRLCAPTPGFSQLITAFFALQLQGIHHGPIFRLTILSFPPDTLSLLPCFSIKLAAHLLACQKNLLRCFLPLFLSKS